MQSQNQRPLRKPPPPPSERYTDSVIPAGPSTATREIRPSQQEIENYHHQNQHLFMQEDEMTSWLQYPIVDDPPLDHNFCTDILYPPPPPPPLPINDHSTMQHPVRISQVTTELRQPSRSVAPRPPIPPPRKSETRMPNFAHFSHHNARAELAGPSSSKAAAAKESTVVDSCDTPAAVASETVRNFAEPTEDDAAARGVAAPSATYEMTATSSPGGSSGSAEPARRPPAEDRKRKGRQIEDSDGHCGVSDFLLPSHVFSSSFLSHIPYAFCSRLSCAV